MDNVTYTHTYTQQYTLKSVLITLSKAEVSFYI